MADVCYVTKTWRSGAAWVAQKTVQAIAEEGLKVAFIAPLAEPESREPSSPNVKRVLVSREKTESGLSARTRVVASFQRVIRGAAAVLLERLSTRVFIFAIPDPLIFTLPVMILLRLTGAKIIFVVHDVTPHAWRFNGFLRWVELQAHLLSYRLSNTLVVMTGALSQELIQTYGFSDRKVAIIPHGPFEIGSSDLAPGHGRFLTFGTFRRNKCILQTIQGVALAHAQDPTIRLVLVGSPHPQERDYWDECLSEIRSCPGAFEVFEGFLPDEQLPEFINRIDAFILAYVNFRSQSGVGIVAGFSERSVIGTSAGGLSELFDAGLSGICIKTPVSAEGIAEALIAFRSKPIDEWRTRAREAKQSLNASISWRAIGHRYAILAFSFAKRRAGSKLPQ